MINPHVTVDRLVLEHPECATILLRHRIDIWRRDRSLAHACRYRGLDVGVVVGELERAIAGHHGAPGEDLERLSNRALAAHLASQHRGRLRRCPVGSSATSSAMMAPSASGCTG
jgi:hypothetical protein